MEVNKFSGKDYDSVLEEALSKLNLKEEEVMVIFNKIILNVTQKFKAVLRDK